MPVKTRKVNGADIVADARRYMGVPYLYGGTNPQIGLDCSGLVLRVCDDLGIAGCPRTSEEQFSWGIPIDKPEPGALVFFTGSEIDPPPGHVGIVVMNGSMINAPYTGVNVRVDNYQTGGSGVNEFLGYRRIPSTVSSPTGTASTLPITTNKQNAATLVTQAVAASGAIGYVFAGILIIIGIVLVGVFVWSMVKAF